MLVRFKRKLELSHYMHFISPLISGFIFLITCLWEVLLFIRGFVPTIIFNTCPQDHYLKTTNSNMKEAPKISYAIFHKKNVYYTFYCRYFLDHSRFTRCPDLPCDLHLFSVITTKHSTARIFEQKIPES